ncbi:MAG: guanylate kinase [Lachnospiraceae bacterium]|nr:guanylate kinase [Lachnospiraceae bacterium]
MGKIFYLMGKSSSGKDTIFKKLRTASAEGAALQAIVPYTTRPIRAGEHEGTEYHFTDEAGYEALLSSGKVIEHRAYQTFYGVWRYFTVDDGQFDPDSDQDYIMIGTLEGYASMKAYFGADKVKPILIELDDGTRLQRALNRERKQAKPKYEEMCRRFLADAEDFSEEKLQQAGIEKRFRNEVLGKCLHEIRSYIFAQHEPK